MVFPLEKKNTNASIFYLPDLISRTASSSIMWQWGVVTLTHLLMCRVLRLCHQTTPVCGQIARGNLHERLNIGIRAADADK
jgi:hypothetical protein